VTTTSNWRARDDHADATGEPADDDQQVTSVFFSLPPNARTLVPERKVQALSDDERRIVKRDGISLLAPFAWRLHSEPFQTVLAMPSPTEPRFQKQLLRTPSPGGSCEAARSNTFDVSPGEALRDSE